MTAKSNKIELSEEFMVMWREGQTLWDVISPSYGDKNEKDKFQKQPSEVFFKKGALKVGLYDEIFLSQVVKFFFRQFPFNI